MATTLSCWWRGILAVKAKITRRVRRRAAISIQRMVRRYWWRDVKARFLQVSVELPFVPSTTHATTFLQKRVRGFGMRMRYVKHRQKALRGHSMFSAAWRGFRARCWSRVDDRHAASSVHCVLGRGMYTQGLRLRPITGSRQEEWGRNRWPVTMAERRAAGRWIFAILHGFRRLQAQMRGSGARVETRRLRMAINLQRVYRGAYPPL